MEIYTIGHSNYTFEKLIDMLNKYNDEYQEAIIEEIAGKDVKDKNEGKNK